MTRRYQSSKAHKGTLRELMAEYQLSTHFRIVLKDDTRRLYRRAMAFLEWEGDDLSVKDIGDLRPADFTRIRDRIALGERPPRADGKARPTYQRRGRTMTPVMADQFAAMCQALFTWADQNDHWPEELPLPNRKLKRLRKKQAGGWKQVPDDVIDTMLRRLSERGHYLWLAIMLAYHTAQRQGDVLRMKWSDVILLPDGNMKVRVLQQKGRQEGDEEKPFHVHCPLSLKAALLAEMHKDGVTRIGDQPILVRKGRRNEKPLMPITAGCLRKAWHKELRRAGFQVTPWHGFRKAAAARIAALGLGAPAIMSMTGHTDPSMAMYYAAQVDQDKLGAMVARLLEQEQNKSASQAG